MNKTPTQIAVSPSDTIGGKHAQPPSHNEVA